MLRQPFGLCSPPVARSVPTGAAFLIVQFSCATPLCAHPVHENALHPHQRQTPASAPNPSATARLSQELQLTGDSTWLDTGIDVQAGEHVLITATGSLRYADAKADNGPQGLTRGFKDLIRVLPFNEAGRGAVIGRIGDNDTAQSFLVGEKRNMPHRHRTPLVGINRASTIPATAPTRSASKSIRPQKAKRERPFAS
jgi:hypothetical protein